MKRIYIKVLYVITSVSLIGCVPKYVNFTKEEKEWFNIYNKDDALIFQNLSTGEKDISVITSKRIYHDDDLFLHDNIIPCVDIDYFNKRNISPGGSSILFRYCNSQKSDMDDFGISMEYLGSLFKFQKNKILESSDTLIISKKAFDNVYKLVAEKKMKFNKGTDDGPEILYWDKNYGIIKYISYNGDIWERINWESSN